MIIPKKSIVNLRNKRMGRLFYVINTETMLGESTYLVDEKLNAHFYTYPAFLLEDGIINSKEKLTSIYKGPEYSLVLINGKIGKIFLSEEDEVVL